MTAVATENIMFWSIVLMVSIPIVTVLLGEVIDRLLRQESRYTKFFQILRAVVLPAVVVLILAKYIFHMNAVPVVDILANPEDPSVIAVVRPWYWFVYPLILSVLYVSLAYAVFEFLSALKGERDPKAWENKIPGLFKAILTLLVFVIPIFMLLAAWNVQIGDFAKVVGVAGIAIGLALQDALSSITKGFLLVIDKPFAVGDWIEVDGVKGKVTDISWRSTRLQVSGNDIVVIPNLIISDNSVYNYTAEDISYRDEVVLGFSYNDAPNKVKEILWDVMMDCPDVMKTPPPKIFTVSYDDFSIGYKIYFFIQEYVSAMEQERIRDDIMNRIWYAADRGGISIPFPITVEGPPRVFEPDHEAIENGVFAFLKQNRYFKNLQTDKLRQLASIAEITPFATGETLFVEGEISSSIGLIRSGRVSLSEAGQDEDKTEHAGPNDIISEIALMGRRAHSNTAIALEDTKILKFQADVLLPIIETNQKFARNLNAVIESRLKVTRHTLPELGEALRAEGPKP